MSTYTCSKCGRDYDENSSVPHECEQDRIEREAQERDADLDERLERIERRQLLLARAFLDMGDGPYMDDDPSRALRKEFEGEL